jgi:SAGA-associated factor 29
MGGTGSGGQPEQPTSANSHKRGRGRKVSFKEAERQRAVAEAMAEERVAPPPSVQGFHYNDSELPVAPREECNLPLCGAVPAAPDYMIPDGSKVSTKPAVSLSLVPAVPLSLVPAVPLSLVPRPTAARGHYGGRPHAAGTLTSSRNHPSRSLLMAHLITHPPLLMLTPGALSSPRSLVPPSQVCAKPPSNKMQPQDWILATILRYSPATNKYTILDEDDADADPWAESSAREHLVSRRMVMPLPLTEPSVYTPYNEFPRGQWILALYPDTTCFYKAMVHTPPSEMAGGPPKDYLVEFEDESEESGRSAPMRVPTKYILRMPV